MHSRIGRAAALIGLLLVTACAAPADFPERPLQVVIGVAPVAVGLWDLSVNLPAFLAGMG